MTQRTNLQNRSAHKYWALLSDEMNKQGITQRMLYDSFKDMDTTPASVKQAFQRVSFALFGIDETHKLSTKQMNEAYEIFDGYINLKYGVSIDWPCNEPPLLEEHSINET